MPFGVNTNNNQAEVEATNQAAEQAPEQETFDVTVPEAEAAAIEEASPTFELTTLPARTSTGGRGGPRGLRHVSEDMANAVVQSEDPDAAILTKYKTVSPQMKEWADERTLRFTRRKGQIFLAKAPADEAPEV